MSIDQMMFTAKTPHLLYMHTGELNVERMNDFVVSREDIADFQILEMINVEGVDIVFNENDLSTSVQDHGFVTQSPRFDYLLDENNQIIEAGPQEVYVPIYYFENHGIQIGDVLQIHGIELEVKGLVRDSQMNSPLASSKRFVVYQSDLEEIEEWGRKEYLIEFRVQDDAKINDLQQAYVQRELEANGPPAITYPLFRMINMISDGLLIALLLVVGFLVLLVTFMSLRFSLRAQLEEDFREVGIMKAIGMTLKDIKKTYLSKIFVISFVGSVLGYVLANLIEPALLERILLTTGGQKSTSGFILGLLGSLLVFLVIIFYSNHILNRIKQISIVDAIRHGMDQSTINKQKNILHLNKNNRLKIPYLLGLKELFFDRKLYRTMLIIMILSMVLVILPSGIHQTLKADNFMRNLGVGDADIRMDLNHEMFDETTINNLIQSLESDQRIGEFEIYQNANIDILNNDQIERLSLTLGNHQSFEIEYAEGSAPIDGHEIAISIMNAEDLNKQTGDVLTVINHGTTQDLTISGTYTDITSGGKTAKATFNSSGFDPHSMMVLLSLVDSTNISAVISHLQNTYRQAKVIEIDAFRDQTFRTTVRAIGQASILSLLVAVGLSLLVTFLFNKLMFTKNKREYAIQWSLGIRRKELEAQIYFKNLLIAFAGIIIGVLVSIWLKDPLGGSILGVFGVFNINVQLNWWWTLLGYPLLMLVSVLLATKVGLNQLNSLADIESAKEVIG